MVNHVAIYRGWNVQAPVMNNILFEDFSLTSLSDFVSTIYAGICNEDTCLTEISNMQSNISSMKE